MDINFSIIWDKFKNLKIKWAAMSGIYADILEERHVRMILPLSDLHTNHVGIAYAGSMFMLAEISTAAIILCTYGTDKWVPIVSRIEMDFTRPTKKDLVVDMRLTEEEAAEKIKAIEERGKGKISLIIPVSDIDGIEVARMNAIMYLMPADSKIM